MFSEWEFIGSKIPFGTETPSGLTTGKDPERRVLEKDKNCNNKAHNQQTNVFRIATMKGDGYWEFGNECVLWYGEIKINDIVCRQETTKSEMR